MSRPTAALLHRAVRGGPRTAAPARIVAWTLVGATVLVQIVYPLVPDAFRTQITVTSVLVLCAAALGDAARVHGPRGPVVLLAVAGGGGLLVEAVGVHSGIPFGTYAYTGDLGAQVLGVPAVVPLAWTIMAWPALVVGRVLDSAVGRRPVGGGDPIALSRSRTALDRAVRRRPVGGGDLTALSRSRTALAGRLPVALIGGVALAAWDLLLDPQMVDAGHWTWAHPDPALPLVPDVPLTNYAGWLVVSVAMVGALDRLLPRDGGPSGPAAALYLWAYGSSVVAHVLFFDRPGSALVGGIVMGAVALPFARSLWIRRGQSA